MTLEDLARSKNQQAEDDEGQFADMKTKRDFFGRECQKTAQENGVREVKKEKGEGKVWVTFHEGFSNAVRKPVTVKELMRGL